MQLATETYEALMARLDAVPKSGPERHRWYRLNYQAWLAQQAESRERDTEREQEESDDDN